MSKAVLSPISILGISTLGLSLLAPNPALGTGAPGGDEVQVQGYNIGTIGGMGPIPEAPLPSEAPLLGYRKALPQSLFYTYVQGESAAPLLLGDRLFVGTTRHPGLHIFEADTGVLMDIWETSTGIESAPILADGRIFVVDTKGQATAYNPDDGAILWRKDLKEAVVSPLRVDQGRLLYQTLGGDLGALDVKSGESDWVYGREKPINTTILGSAGVVPVGDVVLAGFGDGTVVALTADAGEVLWEAPIANPEAQWMDVDTISVLDDECTLVSSFEGPTLCLKPESGAIVWSQKEPIFGDPVLREGVIYGASSEGRILALDRSSGQQLWSWSAPRATVDKVGKLRTMPPVIWEDQLVVATTRGFIHGLNFEDGEKLWDYRPWIEVFAFNHKPLVEGGAIYLLSGGGYLYQFRSQSYQPASIGTLKPQWMVMPETTATLPATFPCASPSEGEEAEGGDTGCVSEVGAASSTQWRQEPANPMAR